MVQKYDIVRITSDCPPNSPLYFEGINTWTGLPVDYWVTDFNSNGGWATIAPRDESFRHVAEGPYEFSFDIRMLTVTEPFTERDDLVLTIHQAPVLVTQPRRAFGGIDPVPAGNETRNIQAVRGRVLEGIFGTRYLEPEILPAAYISDFRESFPGNHSFIPLRAIMSATGGIFTDHTEGAVRYAHPDPTFVLPSAPEPEDEDEEEDF